MKDPHSAGETGDDFRALREHILGLPEEVFDGHTNFDVLTPEQRLVWLSQSVRFVWEARRNV